MAVYTREFKEEAVRLAQTSGKAIAQHAKRDTSDEVSLSEYLL